MDALSRRHFLAVGGGAALVTAAGAWPAGPVAAAVAPGRVDTVPTTVTRTWLAPQYWANRLQDWRLHAGRLECLAKGHAGRTVGVLTRELVPGPLAGVLKVRTGTLLSGAGSSGFLLGAGAGRLDWRAAALVMAASGQGGGLLAVYDDDGQVRFRDHTDEHSQFTYAPLAATARSGPAPARRLTEDVTLQLVVSPAGAGLSDLVLTARDTGTGALLSSATRAGVPDSALVGGLSLVSFVQAGSAARHWLADLRTGGAKVAEHPERTAGPVLATQHSLSAGVLRLTAQLMPVGPTEPQLVDLQVRAPGTTVWRSLRTAAIGPAAVALFRVPGWDSSRDCEYRVVWSAGTAQEGSWSGTVRRDPAGQGSLTVALVDCTIHSYRNLEIPSSATSAVPGARALGLYTADSLYYPYADLVAGIRGARPDLLVALGDQYYENKPTKPDAAEPALDVLGRYALWLMSFRELVRDIPSITLVDDHDVYQGNLWGWAGRAAPRGDSSLGGYVMPPEWVNGVQRMQCAHDPDPFDPTPMLQGISVYYTAFSYGGVSFAVLEDRAFKNTNQLGVDELGRPLPPPRDLLGARQEGFLQAWATMHPGQPKVALTQTAYAAVHTTVDGGPSGDTDSGGNPPDARLRACRLLKAAGALVLAGDQHLATLVRHGLDTFTDGPVQFTVPAAGTAWQRWFEPAGPLPNATGLHTGDMTDAFGNRFRVLAVANPTVTMAQVQAVQRNNDVGDRRLKKEGYGIVQVDLTGRRHVLHCWPWSSGPAAPGAGEYPGWPFVLPFSAV